MTFLRPTVTVSVRLDLVSFASGPHVCALAPVIYIAEARSPGVVLSVGEPPAANRVAWRVELFGGGALLPLDYGELLDAFMRYGVSRLFGGGLRRRPRVCFRVAAEVARYFRHHERAVFMRAGEAAGAPLGTVNVERESAA